MKNAFVLLFLLLLVFPFIGFSQGSASDELGYEVNRVYPYLSVTKEKLNEAQTLMDINRHYKSSWVKAFISVEILTSYNGKIKKAINKSDVLSQEQKDIINSADVGSDISVVVRYIPDNTLKHNDPKEFDFTFKVDPEKEAKYPGGQKELKQYLKETIDEIPEDSFQNYDLTAIKFTISEEGEITNAHVFESVFQTYKNEKVDQLLLEAVRTMPCWQPAEYANGTKVNQEFVLTVGNMKSCVVNLLSIRKD